MGFIKDLLICNTAVSDRLAKKEGARTTCSKWRCVVVVVVGVVVVDVVIGVAIELNSHCSENALSEHKFCEVTCTSFISKQMYHMYFVGPLELGPWTNVTLFLL